MRFELTPLQQWQQAWDLNSHLYNSGNEGGISNSFSNSYATFILQYEIL